MGVGFWDNSLEPALLLRHIPPWLSTLARQGWGVSLGNPASVAGVVSHSTKLGLALIPEGLWH